MSRLGAAVRRAVRRRARGFCEYCRSSSELTGHDFTVDHVLPKTSGGGSDLGNLCWCCFWCNDYKHARTQAADPRTGRWTPLFNPRTDAWETHFRWTRHSTRIHGRTPTGRATVKVLRLNRAILVKARRLWVRHGLHPPDF
jgi:hypothetical protein